ncbi:MAG: hypothetical protein GVY29_01260 [Spirochaetes bacterium]|jgi:hypothetical protein|nr:hypothetical protein [Spirochaetota bacterium]
MSCIVEFIPWRWTHETFGAWLGDWDLESDDGKPTHFHAFVNGVDESGAVYELTPWNVALDPGTYTITLKLANADHKFIGVEDTVEIAVE